MRYLAHEFVHHLNGLATPCQNPSLLYDFYTLPNVSITTSISHCYCKIYLALDAQPGIYPSCVRRAERLVCRKYHPLRLFLATEPAMGPSELFFLAFGYIPAVGVIFTTADTQNNVRNCK